MLGFKTKLVTKNKYYMRGCHFYFGCKTTIVRHSYSYNEKNPDSLQNYNCS